MITEVVSRPSTDAACDRRATARALRLLVEAGLVDDCARRRAVPPSATSPVATATAGARWGTVGRQRP